MLPSPWTPPSRVPRPEPRAAAQACGFSTGTSEQATMVDSIVAGRASMTDAFRAGPPSGPAIVHE
ncbi:hypothetical protein AB0I93_03220 [Streptomyces sp. NPDC049967]|uniref:hypothetical protein n=1 Tax=Streptomyces sp. NPDC049967 TaxID=3155658 RepID=UPI00343F7913